MGNFVASCSAELVIPAFTKVKPQLQAKDVETTRKIANVRIHVERVIGHFKKRYQILDDPLPIMLILFSDYFGTSQNPCSQGFKT